MAITALPGPDGTFGVSPLDANPDIGPNFWYAGDMLLDPRAAYTYNPGVYGRIMGWPTATAIPVIDQVPSAASTSNIVNAATPASGTALTLVSSSGSGVTVGCSVTNALTGRLVTGLLGLDVSAARTVTGTFTNGSPKITFTGSTMLGVQVGDAITLTTSGTLPTPFAVSTTYYVNVIGSGAMMLSVTSGGAPISATSAGSGTQTINVTAPTGLLPQNSTPPVTFGQGGNGTGGPVRFWNPAWALSRTLILTNNGNDTSGTYVVAGYDVYGYPMTQTLTGPSTSTVNTTKAFKYIASITPKGTIASTSVSVGTVDLFGLPMRTDTATFLNMYWNNAVIVAGTTASSTFNAADINTPSATTGDVRGTVYGGSASDGTKRLTVLWTPQPENMTTSVGYLGQQQA